MARKKKTEQVQSENVMEMTEQINSVENTENANENVNENTNADNSEKQNKSNDGIERFRRRSAHYR